jgi:hypothetical protein
MNKCNQYNIFNIFRTFLQPPIPIGNAITSIPGIKILTIADFKGIQPTLLIPLVVI